ncbi:MAG: ABC transporter permease [Clostridia bacterium]|nr:ABC transporter permease [Clostridia bacterium]
MKSKKPLIPYLIWMAIFVVIPLGMIIVNAFTDKSGAFTLENLDRIFFKDPTLRYNFLNSLRVALISTALCLVLAYPIALIMARQKPSTQRLLHFLIMLPMWMNFVLRICSWLLVLQPDGILDVFLRNVGILSPGESNPVYMTETAVILGIVYNYLPFMILPIYTTVAKIPQSLYEAGADLGCSRWKVLCKIVFPLSVPGVISGLTMVFVPAMSSFVISMKLGGFALMGDIIDNYYKGTGGDPHLGAAVSIVLMFFIILSIALMNRFDKDDDVVLA